MLSKQRFLPQQPRCGFFFKKTLAWANVYDIIEA
jgi:hypothetical protein